MGHKMMNLFCLLLGCVVLLQPIFAAEFVDCSQLPKPIRPHECCRFPHLFKRNSLVEHCKQSQSTVSEQCFYECIFEATEIFRNGKFDWRKAEDYVDWVMKTTDPFLPIYKAAYRKCIEKVNGMKLNWKHLNKNGCNPLPEMLFLCVQNEMFASCPSDQWNYDVADCSSKRSFMNNCIRDK